MRIRRRPKKAFAARYKRQELSPPKSEAKRHRDVERPHRGIKTAYLVGVFDDRRDKTFSRLPCEIEANQGRDDMQYKFPNFAHVLWKIGQDHFDTDMPPCHHEIGKA